MHYGMPTLLELNGLEENAKLCAELRLDFIELNMNLPEYQPHVIDVGYFSEIAQKYGVYYTIHLDENLDACDFNDKVAMAYTQTVLEIIDIAKELNVHMLTMHMLKSVHFTLPNKRVFLYEKYLDMYIIKLIAFRDACETAIGDADITIGLENGWHLQEAKFRARTFDLLLESPVFGLTFDVGHSAGCAADVVVVMENLDKLRHMHIHDAKDRKNHLLLGEGEQDLQKYFVLANTHNCRAVIEVKTVDGLRRSVDWLDENWRANA